MLLTVLIVLLVLVVLFAAAAVATQDRDLLLEAPADRADVDLPVVGLQPEDISSVRFGMAVRGYRMSEVDDVLARVAGELQSKDARIRQLEEALIDVVEPQVTAAETFAEDPLLVEDTPLPDQPRWPEPELEPEPDPEPIVAQPDLAAPAQEPTPEAPTPEDPTSEDPTSEDPTPWDLAPEAPTPVASPPEDPTPEDPAPSQATPPEQPAPPQEAPEPAAAPSPAVALPLAHHSYVPMGHPDSHQPTVHAREPEPQPTGVPDEGPSGGNDGAPERD